ncbi:MAG TPA: hypothetical protein VJX67_21380, partial [Blastocatellia bacterium]|nr:hypothetical protein [Blastocatellia bacterium]
MNHADGTVSKSTLINGSWPCVDSFTRAVKTALEAASPFIGGFIGRGLEILLVALVLIPVQLRAQGRGTGETPASTVSSKRPVASTSSEVERYFQGIKKNYPELQAFLQRMPKGADLHNHLSGAVYAEDYIKWSADAGLCLDTASMSAIVPPAPSECTSPGQVPIAQALQDGGLYGKILRAWSMLDWQLSGESGHDHFFSTFGKFGAATGFAGEMLAKTVSEAAHDRVLYVELMTTPNSSAVRLIGQKAGWSSDFDEMRKKMLESMGPALSEARRQLDAAESAKAKLLHCGSAVEDPGCGVTVRYLYQSSRGASKEEVFA